MPSTPTIIHIFPEAAAKPGFGAPCNGCGVCCLIEPCPLGVLLSGRRHGACQALRWQAEMRQYRCGAISAPVEVLATRLPRVLQFSVPWLAWALTRWARRWVAAGAGCDCSVEATPGTAPK
jgi:hypothetical protein